MNISENVIHSENVYRASWLAWPARILCWPLSFAALAFGLLVRLVGRVLHVLGASVGLCDRNRAPQRGIRRYLGAAGRYLTFQGERFPSVFGDVRAEDESPGPWYEARRRLKKSHVAMASAMGFVMYFYVGLAAQAGWIAADWQNEPTDRAYAAPGEYADAPLGCNVMGRNVLSLTLKSAGTALWIGTIAAGLSCLIGAVLGALAGFFGGWVDDVIVWLYTTITSIPYLLLLIAFSFALKSRPDLKAAIQDSFLSEQLGLSLGLFTIVLAIGLTSWVGTCRVVRGEFIKMRDQEFVAAGRALGLSNARIMFKHILPNVFHLVLIGFSLLFVSAIKFEVILSFLGLGLEPGQASWGVMIDAGAQELIRTPSVWWQITSATVALFGLVLCVNLLADTLRDALDPRLKT